MTSSSQLGRDPALVLGWLLDGFLLCPDSDLGEGLLPELLRDRLASWSSVLSFWWRRDEPRDCPDSTARGPWLSFRCVRWPLSTAMLSQKVKRGTRFEDTGIMLD